MSKILGVHQPAETKNYIINGNMDFFQRATTFTAINTTSNQASYAADRWKNNSANVGGSAVNYQMFQNTNVPTVAQSGFESTYSLQTTNLTGITLLAGGYSLPYFYLMEGLDYQRLVGKNVVISFWVYASIAGTYSLSLSNGSNTRSYVTTFAVSGSNTWQFISIPITLDSSVSGYSFNNTAGLSIFIAPSVGSTFQTSTLNTWQTGQFLGATTGINMSATTGATMSITQVSMTEGFLGIGPTGFQRAGKDIQQEQALCGRYYQVVILGHDFSTTGSSSIDRIAVPLPVIMRAAPTTTVISLNTVNTSSFGAAVVATNYVQTVIVGNTSGNVGGTLQFNCDADL